MTLVEFINVLRRWIWLIIAVVIIVSGVTAFETLRSPKSYRGEALLVPGITQITSTNTDSANYVRVGGELAATYAEIVSVQDVMESALEKTGLDWSADSLKSRIAAEASVDAPVFRIYATDSDPGRAVLLTNAVADAFVEYIEEIKDQQYDEAKEEILAEIAEIEGKLADSENGTAPLPPEVVRALGQEREKILNSYNELLNAQVSATDVKVVDPAKTATEVGINSIQTIILAIVAAVISSIIIAFIAEGIRLSFSQKKPEED